MWQLLITSSILISLGSRISTRTIDQQKIVSQHNVYRKQLKIEPLKYSEECAVYAQKWANYLALNNKGLSHSKTKKYGENCYWSSSKAFEIKVVDRWGDEKSTFNKVKRTYSAGSGHYSQMVWRDTKFLGTGMAIAADGSEYWVCTYYPAGNFIGRKAY